MRSRTYARGPVPAGRRLPPAGRRKTIPRRIAIGHGPGREPHRGYRPGKKSSAHLYPPGNNAYHRAGTMDANMKEAERWLRQGERVLLGARNSCRSGNFEWACFQAQQSAEKSLKALLYARGFRRIPARRTEDQPARALVPGPDGRSKGTRQRLHYGAISGQHRGKPDAVLQRGGCRGMHRIRGLDLQRREVLAG